MASAAETLLQLLEHTDGPTLEVLLEPESLLTVLRHAGRDDAETRRAIAGGAKPGELLLSLFREGRTASDLLLALGEKGAAQLAAARKPSPPAEAKQAAPAPPQGGVRTEKQSPLNIIGIVLILAAMIAPGLIASLAYEARRAMSADLPLTLGLIAAAGALSGMMIAWRQERLWVGALCGAVCVLGGNAALYFYGSWRSSLYKFEILLACIVGAIPSFFLYGALKSK